QPFPDHHRGQPAAEEFKDPLSRELAGFRHLVGEQIQRAVDQTLKRDGNVGGQRNLDDALRLSAKRVGILRPGGDEADAETARRPAAAVAAGAPAALVPARAARPSAGARPSPRRLTRPSAAPGASRAAAPAPRLRARRKRRPFPDDAPEGGELPADLLAKPPRR